MSGVSLDWDLDGAARDAAKAAAGLGRAYRAIHDSCDELKDMADAIDSDTLRDIIRDIRGQLDTIEAGEEELDSVVSILRDTDRAVAAAAEKGGAQ